MRKIRQIITAMLAVSLLFAFTACDNEDENTEEVTESAFPERFKVDIPSSISQVSEAKTDKDELSGDDIYTHLTTFIAIGEASAELVEEIMLAISTFGLNNEMDITYTSDDDGRDKHMVVVSNATFEGKTFEYQLTVTDELSESEEDGGKAMQVFWNANPIDGIAILKPYNIDRENNEGMEVMYRIDYSETGANGYDAEMTVYIANYPMVDPSVDPYCINHLKMFAGKKGNQIDVYGNSNHPNAIFFTDDTGFNWAFAASSDETLNIAVAEVGLPPCTLDASDRETILGTYSMHDVFEEQIYEEYPEADSAFVAQYLADTNPPGFFDESGFIASETAPSDAYGDIKAAIQELTPYNPSQINTLTVEFK